MSTIECYLNSVALDMITENDHLNNYCLCSKCTCGKHICPRPNPKLYPKSIFNSYYKINYKRHSVLKRPSNSATPHRKSIFKLESETTTSHDYKGYQQDPSYKVDTSKITLENTSVYKQDFINWGHIKAESTKHNRTQIDSGIKFNGRSTYSSCFQSTPSTPAKIMKPTVNTNILCSGTTDKTPETTMRASYNNCKSIPSQPIHRSDNTMPLPAFYNQYSTVNSINFNTKDLSNTIRRARKGTE